MDRKRLGEEEREDSQIETKRDRGRGQQKREGEKDTKVSRCSRKVKRECYERSCVGLGIESSGTDFF